MCRVESICSVGVRLGIAVAILVFSKAIMVLDFDLLDDRLDMTTSWMTVALHLVIQGAIAFQLALKFVDRIDKLVSRIIADELLVQRTLILMCDLQCRLGIWSKEVVLVRVAYCILIAKKWVPKGSSTICWNSFDCRSI